MSSSDLCDVQFNNITRKFLEDDKALQGELRTAFECESFSWITALGADKFYNFADEEEAREHSQLTIYPILQEFCDTGVVGL